MRYCIDLFKGKSGHERSQMESNPHICIYHPRSRRPTSPGSSIPRYVHSASIFSRAKYPYKRWRDILRGFPRYERPSKGEGSSVLANLRQGKSPDVSPAYSLMNGKQPALVSSSSSDMSGFALDKSTATGWNDLMKMSVNKVAQPKVLPSTPSQWETSEPSSQVLLMNVVSCPGGLQSTPSEWEASQSVAGGMAEC